MQPGEYYIGDLCYVFNSDQWSELIDVTGCGDGIFTLPNGTEIAIFSTRYGDGVYDDQLGNEYPVDSGTIGCVLVDGANRDELERAVKSKLGSVIRIDAPFTPDSDGKVLSFGNVEIDTDPPHEEENFYEGDDDYALEEEF